MIIKITRSTNRISINGTTFISETIPRLPSTNIPIIHLVSGKCPTRRTLTCSENGRSKPRPLQTQENLLARFELGGDQTNPRNPGPPHDADDPANVQEHYTVV